MQFHRLILCTSTTAVVTATAIFANVTTSHAVFASTSMTPIQHVIVIVDENHSFDNVFGKYPSVKGFARLPGTPTVDGIPNNAYLLGEHGHKYYPYLIQSPTVGPLPHGYQQMVNDFNDGHQNGFITQNEQYINAHDKGPRLNPSIARMFSGVYAGEPMGYYDYHLMGNWWDYAQHFAMADHWFQPVFGPTSTNMMYLIAGRAGIDGHNVYYTGRPYEHFSFPNIGDEMNKNGVSWTWYQAGWNTDKTSIADNPFMFFKNYTDGKYTTHIRDINQFAYDASHNELPAVSFVKPPGNLDEHPGPGSNLQAGQEYTARLINDVMASKDWSSTAIILTFDESGGWWDHVVPPQVNNSDGLEGDGPRIPMLLISPYAKQNYVSHEIYDTNSITRFIEYNWHLDALTSRDAKANNLLSMFNFKQFDPAPFYIEQNREGPFPRGNRIRVLVNNFYAAQTGTDAPFTLNGQAYMSVEDLDRNFNLHSFWLHAGSLVIFGVTGKDVVSAHDMIFDSRGNAYVPLEQVKGTLRIRLSWVQRNVLEAMTTSA